MCESLVMLFALVNSRIGGVMVSVLATETKVCGLKPGSEQRILRATKIRNTPSFRRKMKQSAPCRNIVKEP
jgi:hypothetical protein